MRVTPQEADLILGFCTIVDLGDAGYVGGLLLLDPRARPLEFHCTAPVQANRAQRILFGPTLREFLCGDQIAVTLWRQSKRDIALQLTDVPEIAAARDQWTQPVALVAAENAPPGWPRLETGPPWIAVPSAQASELARIESILARRGDWDLCEPFQRIRDAVDEALGRQAA